MICGCACIDYDAEIRDGCNSKVGVTTPVPPEQITPMGERNRIVESFDVLNIPQQIRAEILDALDSPLWNWFHDCDGCTCVSEMYWPTKYFPPCLRHDFDWFIGHGGAESNLRFYRIQRAYGMTGFISGVRYAGVTLAWYGFFKWRDKIWGAPGMR